MKRERAWALGLMVMGLAAIVGWVLVRNYGGRDVRLAGSGNEGIGTLDETREAVAGKEIRRRQGPLDVTFLVASDTHLGFDTPDRSASEILRKPIGIEQTNLRMIRQMNELPGTAWPKVIGGAVAEPRGVLISGDLTEDGGEQDWPMFEGLYGLTGKEGPLRYPVFEGAGNHDRNRNWYVRERVAARHGGRFYSFDFDDLHVVCLGEAPDDEGFRWLKEDLARIAPAVPVIVYFHYPLLGAWSENNWFGEGNYRERLAELLHEVNVLGIFHGHRHDSGAYHWRGFDVYSVGSPKNAWHSFAVVHVTDERMTVASWNYDERAWWWWHEKPLIEAKIRSDAEGRVQEVVGVRPLGERKPSVTL